MRSLRIAEGLALPLETVTQTIAILAKRRAGKSYTMRRIAEQLFMSKQQIVIIDPKGDQHGIRASANGKGPGLPIVILGGEHGDAPLEVGSGEVVARLIVEERVSVLLDLSLFRKHEVSTFMTAFLENLYRLKAREIYRTPVMLIVDEADAIAPQKPQHGQERMLGAIDDTVRRGGQRGLGCILVTQRSAVLNKDVLTQTQILVVLRTIAPQDLKAMKAWIDVHGDEAQGKTLMDSLPSLPIGDAWFWSPGWPTDRGIFQRVHVSPIETFDSGATPKPGARPVAPRNLADVDLASIKKQMAATIERAKADDPRALKAKIAELEAAARRKAAPRPANVYVLKDGQLERLERLFARVEIASARLKEPVALIREAIDRAHRARPTEVERSGSTPPATTGVAKYAIWARPRLNPPPGHKVNAGMRKLLIAIAQHEVGVDRDQLSVLVGLKRSSRDTYLQKLGAMGLVSTSNGPIVITEAGLAELGDNFERLPTGRALYQHWTERLPTGEAALLEAIALAYPESITRDDLSIRVPAYKRSSRDTYLQKLSARRLIVIVDRGAVRMSETLA